MAVPSLDELFESILTSEALPGDNVRKPQPMRPEERLRQLRARQQEIRRHPGPPAGLSTRTFDSDASESLTEDRLELFLRSLSQRLSGALDEACASGRDMDELRREVEEIEQRYRR